MTYAIKGGGVMSRPIKCRRICHYPQVVAFYPGDVSAERAPIVVTLDEMETIRLIDKMGLSQEQCSVCMQIARTTVQKIYESARVKIATALVDGHPLQIEGGDYRICNGQDENCGFDACDKRQIIHDYEMPKGEGIMRLAITYENGQVFQHFGHTEQFKVYDIEDGKVLNGKLVDTNGSGHGALADMLGAMQVDVLICGGIGMGAQNALRSAGIALYGGVSGNADEAAEAFAAQSLQYDPNAKCDHHDHHGGDHDCGQHGCGEHHCGGHC